MNLQIELDLREFKRTDNIEYSSWFADPVMDKHLGPAWSSKELEQIFKEDPGTVLSAFHSEELVGVVSLAFPNKEHSRYGITGVAVKPQKQRQGFGTKIISTIQNHYNTTRDQEWVAFVSVYNKSAQMFIEKQGWKRGNVENDMCCYTFVQCAYQDIAD